MQMTTGIGTLSGGTALSGDGPRVIGHRGAPLLASENSLASFAAALEAGVDGIETDVQRTRDGVLVLHHDPVLGDGRLLSGITYSELVAAHPKVARLDELFALLTTNGSAVANLELKTAAPFEDERAADLASAIGQLPPALKARVWVSSFDPLLLLRLAACRIDVPLAFIVSFAPAIALTSKLAVAAIHPHKRLVTNERVAAWHEAGLRVYAWTLNDRPTLDQMLHLGVDGLVGDDPRLLVEARLNQARDRDA